MVWQTEFDLPGHVGDFHWSVYLRCIRLCNSQLSRHSWSWSFGSWNQRIHVSEKIPKTNKLIRIGTKRDHRVNRSTTEVRRSSKWHVTQDPSAAFAAATVRNSSSR